MSLWKVLQENTITKGPLTKKKRTHINVCGFFVSLFTVVMWDNVIRQLSFHSVRMGGGSGGRGKGEKANGWVC